MGFKTTLEVFLFPPQSPWTLNSTGKLKSTCHNKKKLVPTPFHLTKNRLHWIWQYLENNMSKTHCLKADNENS